METYQDLENNYPGIKGKKLKLKFEENWFLNKNIFKIQYKTFNLEIKVPIQFADEFEKSIERLLNDYKNRSQC